MADTVRTEQDLIDTLFPDGQATNSITPQDMRDFIVSVKYMNGGGWTFDLDSQYTVGAPKTILAGVRTQVTIDGLLGQEGHPTVGAFWSTATNKIIPSALNDFGNIRFAISGQSTSAAVNRFECELDVGGTAGVIFHDTGVFAKGAGAAQSFNFEMSLFAGADFIANGGTIYITPLEDATFWQHGITANRTYLARP